MSDRWAGVVWHPDPGTTKETADIDVPALMALDTKVREFLSPTTGVLWTRKKRQVVAEPQPPRPVRPPIKLSRWAAAEVRRRRYARMAEKIAAEKAARQGGS
jgi:hypothetical protein